MGKKIILETDKFDVVQMDDKFGINMKSMSVCVMPFCKDRNGLPESLGRMVEYNHARSRWTDTAITGRAQGDDPDIFGSAKYKLLEATGLDVGEIDRWQFLGFLNTHKMVNHEFACFSVDLTGLELPALDQSEETEEDDDKTKDEYKPRFEVVRVDQALDTDDCFLPAMFMKMFRYIFGFNQRAEGTPDEESDSLRSEIEEIDGVLGASNDNGQWQVHCEDGADRTAIKSKVQNLVGDQPVDVTYVDKKIQKPE